MPNSWSFPSDHEAETEEELMQMFGDHAVISRVGNFNLVHLDQPSEDEIKRRIREFDPEELFEDDCPICRMLREQGGNIVYDDLV